MDKIIEKRLQAMQEVLFILRNVPISKSRK